MSTPPLGRERSLGRTLGEAVLVGLAATLLGVLFDAMRHKPFGSSLDYILTWVVGFPILALIKYAVMSARGRR